MKDLTHWKIFIRFNHRLIVYLLVLFAGLASTTAHATMMTYTVTGESSGDIDGTAFGDASITFTMLGDSASASSIYSGDSAVWDSGMSVSIGGESYQVSNDIYLYRTGTDINGFWFDTSPEPIPMIVWDAVSADFDTTITQSLTWNDSNYLINAAHSMTAIPVDGQSPPVLLTLTSNNFHSGTYSAAPVPEPGTALLLGLGLFGLVCKRLPTREA